MTTWLEKTNTKEVQWMEENYVDIYGWVFVHGHGVIFLYKSRWQAKTQNQRTIWKIFQRKVKVNQVWLFKLLLDCYEMRAIDKDILIR